MDKSSTGGQKAGARNCIQRDSKIEMVNHFHLTPSTPYKQKKMPILSKAEGNVVYLMNPHAKSQRMIETFRYLIKKKSPNLLAMPGVFMRAVISASRGDLITVGRLSPKKMEDSLVFYMRRPGPIPLSVGLDRGTSNSGRSLPCSLERGKPIS